MFPGRGLKPVHVEHKIGLLTSQPWRLGNDFLCRKIWGCILICRLMKTLEKYCINLWKRMWGQKSGIWSPGICGVYRQIITLTKPVDCSCIRDTGRNVDKKYIKEHSHHFIAVWIFMKQKCSGSLLTHLSSEDDVANLKMHPLVLPLRNYILIKFFYGFNKEKRLNIVTY